MNELEWRTRALLAEDTEHMLRKNLDIANAENKKLRSEIDRADYHRGVLEEAMLTKDAEIERLTKAARSYPPVNHAAAKLASENLALREQIERLRVSEQTTVNQYEGALGVQRRRLEADIERQRNTILIMRQAAQDMADLA